MSEKIKMTRGAYDTLLNKLGEIKSRLMIVAKIVDDARKLGDLSENAEYHSAKELKYNLEKEQSYMEEQLSNAIIIYNLESKDFISFGAVIKTEINGEERTYKIADNTEADFDLGIISEKSPLGKEFLNKKVGDKFNFKGNEYVIKHINYEL
jgi:transcription elongation factor GreA